MLLFLPRGLIMEKIETFAGDLGGESFESWEKDRKIFGRPDSCNEPGEIRFFHYCEKNPLTQWASLSNIVLFSLNSGDLLDFFCSLPSFNLNEIHFESKSSFDVASWIWTLYGYEVFHNAYIQAIFVKPENQFTIPEHVLAVLKFSRNNFNCNIYIYSKINASHMSPQVDVIYQRK